MNEDIDNNKDYQIMELKQRISYYEPYKQKYEDLKEDWKYIKSLLDKEFNERTRLKKENEPLRKELKEYKENWDDLVELATKTSLRNIELDEQIGQLQQGIRIAYEKKPYPTFEDIQNEINNDIMVSEDIHKWVDGRYTLMFDEHTFFVWDNEKEERMCALNVTKKLNEQQATISDLKEGNEKLRKELKEIKENPINYF